MAKNELFNKRLDTSEINVNSATLLVADKDGCNRKLEFVIFPQVNLISLLLLQILAAIGNYQYLRMRIFHMNWSILANIL